jgi:hypothetical protein
LESERRTRAVACNFATLGEVDESLDYLEQAIENGMVNASWMSNDEDLANLRGHPRYERILDGMKNPDHSDKRAEQRIIA